MKYIERDRCVILGTEDLEDLHVLKNFPVYMGCTNQSEKDDLTFDMEWNISKKSGVIQLKKMLPLDILYPENHAGSVGDLWAKHHIAFAKFINKYSPKSVIEIGGAHGILSKEYQKYANVDWTIVEPNPIPVEGVKAKFIKTFFNDFFVFEDDYDAVVHSHVFEHIYEPDIFVKHLSDFMDTGKYLIFSIPNMQVMLERKYTNCINFEHTIFLAELYIEYLLAKHKFELKKKEYFMNDHSIFYCAVKNSNISPIILDSSLYKINKKLYLDYVEYHQNLVNNLNKKLNLTKQPVYLFGAHIFSQYLLAFGLNETKIVCLLDNDSNKQNKRLYGTSLKVNSPQILKDIQSPIVILKAGVYNNEIKKDILENINSDALFWE